MFERLVWKGAEEIQELENRQECCEHCLLTDKDPHTSSIQRTILFLWGSLSTLVLSIVFQAFQIDL